MLPSLETEKRTYLLSRRDNHVFTSWRGYENLFTPDMQKFESRLTPTVIGVVHPGWDIYVYGRTPSPRYEAYRTQRNKIIRSAMRERITILAWIPADQRRASVNELGIGLVDQQVIFLPNGVRGDGCTLDSGVLGSHAEQHFWESMKRKVTCVKFIGEYWNDDYGDGCVGAIVARCKQHIPNSLVIPEATYRYVPQYTINNT